MSAPNGERDYRAELAACCVCLVEPASELFNGMCVSCFADVAEAVQRFLGDDDEAAQGRR